MYGYDYRGRGGFGRHSWLPKLLVLLVVLALFSGAFHRIGFFLAPLFCVLPFMALGGIAFLIAMRKLHGGYGHFGPRGPFSYYGRYDKPKRGISESDSDSDIYYV